MRLPRIALVHDWLLSWYGGSERVVAKILEVFPQADVFSLFEQIPPHDRGFLQTTRVQTSFLQRLPSVQKYYRRLLPVMPLAIESFDLSSYDLVISSSHAVAKGVITGPGQVHICYCHSPIRYAWDLQHQYLKEAGLNGGLRKLFATAMLHYLRIWDLRTSPGVDHFISNSEFVARRIKKVYGRAATVIHPPVEVDHFSVGDRKDDVYVTVARLVPYKKISLLVDAFRKLPDRQLVVVGDGPLMNVLRASAPANVEFVGHQPFAVMQRYLQQARAFLYAAEEDFGISIVEAQACGTPVIAYGSGGAGETVIAGRTGLLFREQTPESVVAAINQFEASMGSFPPRVIRQNAERFAAHAFCRRFKDFVVGVCRDQDANATLRHWAANESVRPGDTPVLAGLASHEARPGADERRRLRPAV